MKATIKRTNNFNTTLFNELNFVSHPMGNGMIQCIVEFKNGYGASIVQGAFTYGGGEGLYEIAVFGKDGKISYKTPITNDVLGNLNKEDVEKILIDIKNL